MQSTTHAVAVATTPRGGGGGGAPLPLSKGYKGAGGFLMTCQEQSRMCPGWQLMATPLPSPPQHHLLLTPSPGSW